MRADCPRVTHPCATLLAAEAAFAFDLHVLSTPPAFNLSQNQTLQFKSVSRSLLGRNQNLKDFLPTRYSLVNEPPPSRPAAFQRRGAGLCTLPLSLSTSFSRFSKKTFAAGKMTLKRGKCNLAPLPRSVNSFLKTFCHTWPFPAIPCQHSPLRLRQNLRASIRSAPAVTPVGAFRP